MIFELNLSTYKTIRCSIKSKHNYKQCPMYHYDKDRKRIGFEYCTEMCEFVGSISKCPNGENCLKSHSRIEAFYHPSTYRMKLCEHYPDRLEDCPFGEHCSFAHSISQLKIPLIENIERNREFYILHYKTVFCPYNLISHDRATCCYAHNWQDYRRAVSNYTSEICPDWDSRKFVKLYNDGGCGYGMNCSKSHGWKESEFHPSRYKMNECKLIKCLGGLQCPYYHLDMKDSVAESKLGEVLYQAELFTREEFEICSSIDCDNDMVTKASDKSNSNVFSSLNTDDSSIFENCFSSIFAECDIN